MQQAVRMQTTILSGHRLEVCSPELPEGSLVEVIVLVPAPAAPSAGGILDYLDSLPVGPRSYPSWAEFEQAFQQERTAWDR